MAMGIFLDNEIMYDRALRYIQGLPHRSDDLPYPVGPRTSTGLVSTGDYADTYGTVDGGNIEDFGYNEVMTHYIWENGQCQESSRDQQHTFFGIGLLCSMAEMAWNQGDDLYTHENERLLLGLEYNMRYNVSVLRSYPDQPNPWVPTVNSGEFIRRFDRTGRWYSKAMSPIGEGEFSGVRPVFEMPLAHYYGRGFKSEDEVRWIKRARDIAIDESGYEAAGWTNDAIGWGALTARRPEECYGDPVSGFTSSGLPIYEMNVLPMTIEAENYDYSPVSGQGRVYSDVSSANQGGDYRPDESVDIEECSDINGGYNIGWTANGEWLTYTVHVPRSGTYDVSVRYSARNSNGKVKFSFGGVDKTGEVTVPSTGGYDEWSDFTVASGIELTEGVQSMKLSISGTSSSYNINNITISLDSGDFSTQPIAYWSMDEGSGNTVRDIRSRCGWMEILISL